MFGKGEGGAGTLETLSQPPLHPLTQHLRRQSSDRGACRRALCRRASHWSIRTKKRAAERRGEAGLQLADHRSAERDVSRSARKINSVIRCDSMECLGYERAEGVKKRRDKELAPVRLGSRFPAAWRRAARAVRRGSERQVDPLGKRKRAYRTWHHARNYLSRRCHARGRRLRLITCPRLRENARHPVFDILPSNPTRPLTQLAYLVGCGPGENSDSFICAAVSACRARSINRSRSAPGGMASASGRSRLASSPWRLSSGSICLKRRRFGCAAPLH